MFEKWQKRAIFGQNCTFFDKKTCVVAQNSVLCQKIRLISVYPIDLHEILPSLHNLYYFRGRKELENGRKMLFLAKKNMFFIGIFRGLHLTKICSKVNQIKFTPIFGMYKQKFSD